MIPNTVTEMLDRAPPGAVLPEMRAVARDNAERLGLPTRRLEDWRFTDLRRIERLAPSVGGTGSIEGLDALIAVIEATHLVVLVDGRVDRERSRLGTLPAATLVDGFAAWSATDAGAAAALFDLAGGIETALRQVNAAWFTDGIAVIVPDHAVVADPIHVLHWNGGVSVQTRSLIRLGAGAALRVVEHHAGTGTGWTNAVEIIEAGAGATLSHLRLQEESGETGHTVHVELRLDRGARAECHVTTSGGGLSRTDIEATLAGQGAAVRLSGVTLLDGTQDATTATLVRHASTDGTSRQVFKYCLGDAAHGAFQGRIAVAEDAQRTDAMQSTRTVLLGERATMNAKPELEILADDVKCSHGAALGDLDETALFYCRSRGIPADEARRMLLAAFLGEAVDELGDPDLRALAAAALDRGLARFGGGAS